MLFDSFVKDREHPNHWYNRANDLKAAAGVLSFSMEGEGERNSIKEYIGVSSGYSLDVACLNPYYLLCGLSIEALLKHKISLLSDKAVQLNTHTLLSLVDKLNISLAKSDRLKLEYLTLYVVWGGKYPYPKKIQLNNGRGFIVYMKGFYIITPYLDLKFKMRKRS